MNSHIVVVDDEPDVLELLRSILESEEYAVIPMPRPELIDNIDTSYAPALFLLDLMLPGVSGIELAQQLRDRGFTTTPIIAMSASPTILQLAAESGLFQEVIAKPFDLSALVDCVRRYSG